MMGSHTEFRLETCGLSIIFNIIKSYMFFRKKSYVFLMLVTNCKIIENLQK
jgi:hypothetical protein